MPSGKYKWEFQNTWLTDERFCGWITKPENDPHAIVCSFCRRSFSVAGQGIEQLESHMMGEKHKQKTPPDPAASKPLPLMFAPTSDPTWGTNTRKDNKEKRQHTLDKTMLGENTVKAKIMQSLQVLKNKYPYWSCASKSSLFANVQK